MSTMTIKELAEVAGCNEKTIRRVLKKDYPSLQKKGKTTRLTKEQAFDIMGKLPKRNEIENLVQGMDKFGQEKGKVVQSENKELIASIVAETIKQLLPYLKAIPANKEQAQIEALPPINPRDEVRKLVAKHNEKTQIPYGQIWNFLYDEAYYRLHKNFRLLAANREVPTLDMIDELGCMPQFLALTREVLSA